MQILFPSSIFKPTSILRPVKNCTENRILHSQSSCIIMDLFKTLKNYVMLLKSFLYYAFKLSYINLESWC